MREYRLIRKHTIARRASHDLVITMAKYGNHPYKTPFGTDADVKRFFLGQGIDFKQLVEKCRNYQERIPFFENIIGSTWDVTTGTTLSRVDFTTGKEDLKVQGPGTFAMSTYWSLYETANNTIKQAIDKASYANLQSALVHGIASIEAYLNYRVGEWNKKNTTDLLIDSKQQKVSFDDKVDIWIPKMTSSKKLDKSNRNWADFKVLRSIRDNLTIHPKSSGFSISFQELADAINRFRTGNAGLLIQLHHIFNEKIPSVIIRGYYAPEVEVIEIKA